MGTLAQAPRAIRVRREHQRRAAAIRPFDHQRGGEVLVPQIHLRVLRQRRAFARAEEADIVLCHADEHRFAVRSAQQKAQTVSIGLTVQVSIVRKQLLCGLRERVFPGPVPRARISVRQLFKVEVRQCDQLLHPSPGERRGFQAGDHVVVFVAPGLLHVQIPPVVENLRLRGAGAANQSHGAPAVLSAEAGEGQRSASVPRRIGPVQRRVGIQQQRGAGTVRRERVRVVDHDLPRAVLLLGHEQQPAPVALHHRRGGVAPRVLRRNRIARVCRAEHSVRVLAQPRRTQRAQQRQQPRGQPFLHVTSSVSKC